MSDNLVAWGNMRLQNMPDAYWRNGGDLAIITAIEAGPSKTAKRVAGSCNRSVYVLLDGRYIECNGDTGWSRFYLLTEAEAQSLITKLGVEDSAR